MAQGRISRPHGCQAAILAQNQPALCPRDRAEGHQVAGPSSSSPPLLPLPWKVGAVGASHCAFSGLCPPTPWVCVVTAAALLDLE